MGDGKAVWWGRPPRPDGGEELAVGKQLRDGAKKATNEAPFRGLFPCCLPRTLAHAGGSGAHILSRILADT